MDKFKKQKNDFLQNVIEKVELNDYMSCDDFNALWNAFLLDEIGVSEFEDAFDDEYYDTLGELASKLNLLTLDNGESFLVNTTKNAIKEFLRCEDIPDNAMMWGDIVRFEEGITLANFYNWYCEGDN